MPDIIVKKDGTDYPLQTMPLHYPADRVYLNGDTNDDAESAIDGKVSKSGDTMTGDLTLGKASTVLKIRASGSRYTNLTSAATGSDKDIVLPNKSGTIALTSDISDLTYSFGVTPKSTSGGGLDYYPYPTGFNVDKAINISPSKSMPILNNK